MIKKYGVSLAQFVLTGEYNLLGRYMGKLSQDNRLQFQQQFYIIEDVLNAEDQVKPDYTACLRYGILPKDVIKLERKYIKGIQMSWEPTVTEEMFHEFYKEFTGKQTILPNRFNTEGLSSEQILIASKIYQAFKKFYKDFHFHTMKELSGQIKIGRVFGAPADKIDSILYRYSQVESLGLLRVTLPKLQEIKNLIDQRDTAKRDTLPRDLGSMVDSMKNLSKLLGDKDLPNVSEVDMGMVWLRLNEAGLVGLDPYMGNIVEIKTTTDVILNLRGTTKTFLYDLLIRDVESHLFIQGGN